MNTLFKKISVFVVLLIIMVCLTSCNTKDMSASKDESTMITGEVVEKIKIPDLFEVDELSAKNVLSSNALIPKVKYIYDDTVEIGYVVKTVPSIGMEVQKNSPVTIYISKGSSYVESKDSLISWYNISDEQDEWEFSNPYISEDIMYIDCNNVVFAEKITWSDRYQKGILFGEACINDTFDKTVPVRATYEKQTWKANEGQSFILEIPLADLEENRPTTIFIKLFAEDRNDKQFGINISFSITW